MGHLAGYNELLVSQTRTCNMSYGRVTNEDRIRIAEFIRAGKSDVEMASVLAFHKSTIAERQNGTQEEVTTVLSKQKNLLRRGAFLLKVDTND